MPKAFQNKPQLEGKGTKNQNWGKYHNTNHPLEPTAYTALGAFAFGSGDCDVGVDKADCLVVGAFSVVGISVDGGHLVSAKRDASLFFSSKLIVCEVQGESLFWF